MMSFKLWQAVHHPPVHHPLFTYTYRADGRAQDKIASGVFIWSFMGTAFWFIASIFSSWALLSVLACALALNTVYYLRWAHRISRIISDERDQRRFELFSTLPPGMLGTSWVLSMGCLHRRSSFRWLPNLMRALASSGVMMMLVLCVATTFIIDKGDLDAAAQVANIDVLKLGILCTAALAALYIDHVYSMLVGLLCGIVAPAELTRPEEATTHAVLGFGTLQVLTYAGIGVILWWLLPLLTSAMTLLLASIMGIIAFVLLREAQVYYLWRRLMQSHNATDQEIDIVLRPANLGGDLL